MAAFYSITADQFLSQSQNEIFGNLVTAHLKNFYELNKLQEKSWKEFVKILLNVFKELKCKNKLPKNSALLFEYKIPRREKRIDCVIIIASQIIVLEFKFSDKGSNTGKIQLEDYCLDIRDFHRESRNRKIFPILLSTSSDSFLSDIILEEKLVQNVIKASDANLIVAIETILNCCTENDPKIDYKKWDDSAYSPTPTIIEAVKTLYNKQSVEEITRHHAGIENLNRTTDAVVNAIREAQASNRKIICFITGVPGAGKTLAGLNIAHLDEFQFADSSLATFLSGNVPLINVLREALKRDLIKKYKRGEKEAKENEVSRISTFLEKVHTFIDTYYFEKNKVPETKILIFDEAQRAWSKEHKIKKSKGEYNQSEPYILFDIMNRHQGWCAVVALIGGGQEINTGESGLQEWGKAISTKFKDWKVFISPYLTNDINFSSHKPLFKQVPKEVEINKNHDFHLAVSIRSYNAEKLSDWVNSVLNLEFIKALGIYNTDLKKEFPIFLTRDLEKAKRFLKTKRLGTRRVGLVASSGGRRLRADGIDVDIALDEVHWFLNATEDIRSSNFLELAGKDFKIQGLELDWTCVCWDADLTLENNMWKHSAFGGTKWRRVNKLAQKEFIENKYRVLMTRAREGMVIFVPKGDMDDETRVPEFYDPIYEYLMSCGLNEI